MKKTIIFFLSLIVCGLSGFALDNTDDPKYMVIVPQSATAPAIDGKFTAEEWGGAVKLTGFSSVGFGNYGEKKTAARERTEIYLLQDKIYLYCAAIYGDEDMKALAGRFLSDQKLAVWSVPRVELFFGNETGNFLQIITDYQGRIYRNIDKSFFCALSQTSDGYIIEYAIPKAVIIRSDLSEQVIKANFYRVVAEPASGKLINYSWAPLPTGSFHSVEYFGALLLTTPRELAKEVIAEERADLSAKQKNRLIDEMGAKAIEADLTAAQEKFPAEVKTYNELLAQLKKLNNFKQRIADAQRTTLQNKYGAQPVRLLPAKDDGQRVCLLTRLKNIFKQRSMDAGKCADIPDRWVPKKVNGRHYWYMYTALAIENLDQFGIMDVPVLKEGMFFFRGGKQPLREFLPPDGESYKFLQKYPKPFALSSGTGLSVDKSDPKLKAFTQSDLPEKFLDYYKDKGFVGFFADEAGVGDYFPDLAKKMGYPVPKNRKEAFEILKNNYFYEGKDGRTPFRTISTLNPLTRKYSSTASGAHIHHMIMSFGDMMTGQELGETMTCSSVYMAFARGAARQYGRPWRNYEIYYGGQLIPGSRSMQCQTIDHWPRVGGVRLLTPENRYTAYHYTAGLLCGTTLPMQKWMILYPYMAGCAIQSSETDICELAAAYELDKIEKTDPLAINLRDQKLYPSPMLKLRAHFYDNIVKKRDRGVSVTPVGLIFDRHHGYAPLYLGNVWGFFLPNEAEKMMWAVDAALFARLPGNPVYSNGPYGDIFDVLTNDAELESLVDYKVILPVGDVDFSGDFGKNLMKYVRNGGTLILNTGNLAGNNPFPVDFVGTELSAEVKTADSTFSRLGNQVIVEDVKYQYTVVKPAGAEVLAVTADIEQSPVMLANKYGKGRVILTTPLFLKEPKSMTKMLKLFDHLMKEVRRESLPIEIKTPIEYMVNRNQTGWVILLCNNFGIPPKGVFKTPPQVDESQVRQAVITVPAGLGKVKQAIDWWTGQEVPFKQSAEGTTLTASLPGGDVRAIEFIME